MGELCRSWRGRRMGGVFSRELFNDMTSDLTEGLEECESEPQP